MKILKMQVSLSKNILVCSIVCSMLKITSGVANANIFYDFEDGLPSDAIFIQELLPTLPDDPNFDYEPIIETLPNGNNVLRLGDKNNTSAENGGAATSSLLNPNISFANVKVSAELNSDGDTNDRFLLLARTNLDTFDTYSFGIDFETDQILLRKIVGGVIDTPLVQESVPLDQNTTYFAEFTVIGNELTGSLFDETSTNLLSEISFFDNDPLAPGVTGISTDISDGFLPQGNDINNGTIDNFSAMSVPEPSSIFGILMVGALANKISRRKWSK